LIGLSYRLHVPEYLFVDDITPRQQFLRFGKVNSDFADMSLVHL